MRPTDLFLAAALIALAAPATAQDVQTPAAPLGAEDDGAAFSMVPAEGRHLKIDRRSGAVSICSETDGAWSCRLVADDRLAYEEEIERLEEENRALEERVAGLERRLAEREEAGDWLGPEDERKLEEFFDFSDKALRRFFGMVEDLKRDFDQPDAL